MDDETQAAQDEQPRHAKTVRTMQRILSGDEQRAVTKVKTAGMVLLEAIDDGGGDQRCAALARTKTEEAVMWATKAITA